MSRERLSSGSSKTTRRAKPSVQPLGLTLVWPEKEGAACRRKKSQVSLNLSLSKQPSLVWWGRSAVAPRVPAGNLICLQIFQSHFCPGCLRWRYPQCARFLHGWQKATRRRRSSWRRLRTPASSSTTTRRACSPRTSTSMSWNCRMGWTAQKKRWIKRILSKNEKT